jgi:hypothetical protein
VTFDGVLGSRVGWGYGFKFVSASSSIRLLALKKRRFITTAAERQDPNFLIGPRNKKKTEKKGRPLKFFIHRSKVQADISDEI